MTVGTRNRFADATLRRVATTLSTLAAGGGFDPDPPGLEDYVNDLNKSRTLRVASRLVRAMRGIYRKEAVELARATHTAVMLSLVTLDDKFDLTWPATSLGAQTGADEAARSRKRTARIPAEGPIVIIGRASIKAFEGSRLKLPTMRTDEAIQETS